MRVIFSKYLVIVVSVLTFSCSSTLEPKEYDNYVRSKDNGLHKVKQVGEYVFDLQYEPYDFIMLTENRGKLPENESYNSRLEELNGLEYVTLKIGISDNQSDLLSWGIVDEAGLKARQNYFSFGLQNDIKLITDGKEQVCQLFHFERSYDMKPQRTFLLAFKKTEGTSKVLEIDSPFISVGKVNIAIENIDNIPQLKRI